MAGYLDVSYRGVVGMPKKQEQEDKGWYIIHAYSGREGRVRRNLEQRVATRDVVDKICQVVVPTEEQV